MSNLQMPKIEKSIISNKNEIVSDLEKIVKSECILSHQDELKPYETDALAAYTQSPMLVVLPETVNEVSEVLKYCNKKK
jgi:glycolate oxidase